VDEWSLPGYITLRELGRGGFGRVVLARHEGSGTHVAVKYLTAPDERFRTEFRAEAQILRGLDDPYVVRLFEYVEEPQGAAIVMEAIDGVSLRALLSERGTLEPEAALALLKGSLLGLGAAHRVGVVHRDYKPANVMVDGDGRSKLIDFGIALRSGAAGQIIGTPAYMAPEQWAGAPASPSTDVYAATCVFFECVTGRTPYQGHTTEAYRAQHTNGEIPADQAPQPVQSLIYRGLAKHPAGRPPGALEFAEELEMAAAAEYGPQWESNGRRRLAEAALGLATLFPLAWLIAQTAQGGAAGVGGAAAGAAGSGGAAGAAGNAAAAGGRGVLAKVGASNAAAKVAVVAGGAVVAGSVTAAVVLTRHHKPKPTPAARVELASYTRPVAGLDLRSSRYVRVTGLRDAALQRRINDALFGPLDLGIAELRQANAEAVPPCTKPTVLDSKPAIGLRGKRLLSVRYSLPKQGCFDANFDLPDIVVNIDLRTGKALTATDVFRPETLTSTGIATLVDRMMSRTPAKERDLAQVCFLTPPSRADFDPGGTFLTKRPQPPKMSPFFTANGLTVVWSHVGSECSVFSVTLPYSESRDLLTPQITAELPR
jgi:serine/threonine-protein kinase